jgi:hypothetical protein
VAATRKLLGKYISLLRKFPRAARSKFQKIAWTKSREEAIMAMKRALGQPISFSHMKDAAALILDYVAICRGPSFRAIGCARRHQQRGSSAPLIKYVCKKRAPIVFGDANLAELSLRLLQKQA